MPMCVCQYYVHIIPLTTDPERKDRKENLYLYDGHLLVALYEKVHRMYAARAFRICLLAIADPVGAECAATDM